MAEFVQKLALTQFKTWNIPFRRFRQKTPYSLEAIDTTMRYVIQQGSEGGETVGLSREERVMFDRHWTACLLAVVISFGCLPTAWSADKYVVDPVHTTVGFVVKHLMIYNVRGKFNEFSGAIMYDAQDITKSSLRGTIQVASLDTDDEKRDQDLRSATFLDAEKYPEIVFQSTHVERQGDGYVLHGDLTLHSTTKPVAVPFTVSGPVTHFGKTIIGFEARLELNRHEF
jgi:polyisoprenoid-binding protein YceI